MVWKSRRSVTAISGASKQSSVCYDPAAVFIHFPN
jgi:hypothetical protein